MKNNLNKEIIISVIFIALIVLVVNPFHMWMPTMLWWMVVLAAIIVFALFAIFVWKESARDEREGLHRLIAGRIGFLVGAGMLLIGITVQSITKNVDQWLLITLAAMVLAKLVATIYTQRKL